MTMSSVEDCDAVIQNLDGKVRNSRLFMCFYACIYPCIINLRYKYLDCFSSFLLSFCFLSIRRIWLSQEYMGRTLRVNFSDKPKDKDPLYPETDHKLFVGNLSWSVTSESLTLAFQEYGNVVGARVLYDGETGRSRGYGFVCYSTKSEMETALDTLNGAVISLSFPTSFLNLLYIHILALLIALCYFLAS